MRSFLRGILGGTMLIAAATAPAWAADPGARTQGAYSNGNTPSAGITDTITTNVRSSLAGDRLLKGAVITVATSETGKVTLVGLVPNVTAKRQAVDIAKVIPGVSVVDDQLRLYISSPDAPAQN
ncbi:MAG TPA: BON domain-containing protein [Polyangia bacterium]